MTLSTPEKGGAGRALATPVAAAWLVTLAVSSLPDAVWHRFAGAPPAWLFAGKVGLLLAVIVLASAWRRVEPLRLFFVLLLVNVGAWWLLPRTRATAGWLRWEERAPWVMGLFGIQLLKIGVALVTLAALLILMRRRSSFFLVRGRPDALAQPVPWLGMNAPTSWKILGPIVAVAAAAIMTVALVLTSGSSTTALARALPLLPAVLLFAATNAFAEEVSFRSALLAPLHGVVGKGHALALTAVFFGLAHASGGVPLATLPTIAMTAFLGWLMAKSMLETRGFLWAWLIHFVNDIPVFFFLAMGSAMQDGP